MVAFVACCVDFCSNTQKHLIKEARLSDREYDYSKYLEKYPTGKYATEAYDALYSILQEKDVKQIYSYALKYEGTELSNKLKDLAYEKIKAKNSVCAWKYYKSVVKEEDLRDANEQIEVLDKAKWGTDAIAWNTACEENRAAAYEKYIQRYPRGKYFKEAKKRAIDLAVASDFAGKHGTLPSMDKVAHSSVAKGKSQITVTNGTNYTLTLLYSGQHSDRLELKAHQTKTLTLPNGSYRVSARVDASRVRPFVGNETMDGGHYEVRYYIQTTRY